MHACMLSCFSHDWFCVTPSTAAHQAPLPTGFSRQEYWSGLPFPSPEGQNSTHQTLETKIQEVTEMLHPTCKPALFSLKIMRVSVCVQSCPTLCNPMDCSLPVSSVRGIFQARILECVAFSCSRDSSRPGDQTLVSYVSCISRWILFSLSLFFSLKFMYI